MCLWRAVTMNGRVRWRLARVYTHTHTHLYARVARVSEHTWAYHAPRTIFLQGVTRSPYPYVYAWNNRLTDGYALVSVRLHSLSPFSVTVPSFLPSPVLAHTRHARHLSALGGEKIKKKKKNTNGQCRRSARFFGSTLNAFQARRKKLTVRHRLLTGKPLAWLDTVLFSCAHVPRSVNKNDTCLYPASVEIIYVKSRLSGRDREEACEFWYNRNLISPLWSLLHDNC